ncbi:MAG: multiheme c-type cytochrome [Ignavibacteriales bacterium]
MLNKLIVGSVLLGSITFFAFKTNGSDDTKKYGYVGVEKCGMCHKSEKQGKQLTIWQESKHSQAFKTLQTQTADSIAAAKGFKTKAAETEACLKCHTSGYNVEASLKGPKFKVEDGVQCETCHGAGSEYQALKVMKNREEAISKGLIVHTEKEKFCTGCHNSESPTFVGFDYDKYWAKISHMVPKEK